MKAFPDKSHFRSIGSGAGLLLAAALFLSPGIPAAATEFMTRAELLATIPGKSIQGKSNDGTPWVQTYATGKTKGAIEGLFGKQKIVSKWYVEGNKWCENWGSGHACWDVERVDATSLRMYENGTPKKNLWKLK
jgi:hypothetical protein